MQPPTISNEMGHFELCLFVLLCAKFASVKSASNVIPESILSCEEAPNQVDFTNKDVAGGKSWTGEVNVPFLIDSSSEFIMDFRWYKDGKLEENGKILKGKACFYIKKFGENVWNQIKNAATPKIEGDCEIKEGKFQFTDFVPDLSEMFLPMAGSGKANIKVTMAKDDNTFCAVFIVDIK